MNAPVHKPEKILVTGGGGFLGRAIVQRLLARGDHVRSFARGAYPELEAVGVEVMRGDLTDLQAVRTACRDRELVFHTAAKPGVWGSWESFYQPNFLGTKNILAACRLEGVTRLVYTSSPSVVFSGTDLQGVDESLPYPTTYHAHYPKTKALAEQLVLAASCPQLQTVALRPHLIWGPGDPHLIPRLIERHRRLRIIGHGRNLVDATYIDNAADAHLFAGDRLGPHTPVAGRVYFISQGEPLPLWDLINRILAAAGLPPVTRRIPRWAACALGGALELAYRLLPLNGEPRLTRFVADELATDHWFDLAAARRDLGYQPKISTEAGLIKLAEWFQTAKVSEAPGRPLS